MLLITVAAAIVWVAVATLTGLPTPRVVMADRVVARPRRPSRTEDGS
jgi:hypothetical protein